MTFEEWWGSHGPRFQASGMKWNMRDAWDAAVKSEREACAKVCDSLPTNPNGPSFNDDLNLGCYECATAIRMRPNNEVSKGENGK